LLCSGLLSDTADLLRNGVLAGQFSVSVAILVTPPYAAEIVTLVGPATLVVMMLNFAEVAPAATITVAGTVADTSELLNETTAPPDGAGPFKYTVFAVDDPPPANDVGDRTRDEAATGLRVSVADLMTPPYDADTVTLVMLATALVLMPNFAEVAPAGIVTVAGTITDGSELLSVTTAPLDGAGPLT
jgi:hypothetical protein